MATREFKTKEQYIAEQAALGIPADKAGAEYDAWWERKDSPHFKTASNIMDNLPYVSAAAMGYSAAVGGGAGYGGGSGALSTELGATGAGAEAGIATMADGSTMLASGEIIPASIGAGATLGATAGGTGALSSALSSAGGLFTKSNAPYWLLGGSSLLNYMGMQEQSGIMQQEADAMTRLSDMQLDLYGQGQPLRDMTYGQLEAILSGKLDPSTLPMYANYRNPREQQYAQARKGIESNVRGEGALARALAALESSRASDIGSIPGQMYDDAFNKALSIANPALASQQLQSAAVTRQPIMNMATNLYQQSSQQLGQTGQTLGMMLYDQYLTGNS